MNTVPREAMAEAWDQICEMDEEAVDALVKEFMEQEPALGIYLFASTEELDDGGEKSPVIDLVTSAWLAMRAEHGGPLPEVTPEQIESAEDANQKFLQELDEGPDMDWDETVRLMIEAYNQREILGFGLDILMSDNEAEPELAPESMGLEMLWFKTVVDCLDQ